jgi:ABC-type Fe3+ transport system substrate-binding protein
VKALASLLAALALAGCTAAAAPPPPDPRIAEPVGLTGPPPGRAAMTALYRKALAAGEHTVVVYSCTGAGEWEPLWREFARTFPGITVTYSHISPSQVMTRINAETATGRRFGDVYVIPVNIAEDIADKGYFRQYTPVTATDLASRWSDPRGYLHYPLAKVFGLAYNTRTVPTAALPQRVEDVLDPRWRGRFSYIKPGTMNGTPDVAIANLKRAGAVTDAQLVGLRDNGAFGAIEAGVTYVSQGRQDLQLWAYLPTVVRQNRLGAPVKIAFVPDFSTLVPFGAAISRNVVRPNAAELFKTWLFTPAAQAVLAREVSMYATMPGAPLPPFFPGPEGQAAFHEALSPTELQVALADQKPGLRAIFNAPVRR